MIYVLVEETGEYSSYNKQLVFASLSEDVIKSKLVEFEKQEEVRSKIYNEYWALWRKYNEENPYPPVSNKKAYAEHATKRDDWTKTLLQDLSKKYNMPIEHARVLDDKKWYSIEEVESD